MVAAASGSLWLPSQIWKGECGIPGLSPQVSQRVLTLRLPVPGSCSTGVQEVQSGTELRLGPCEGKDWAWCEVGGFRVQIDTRVLKGLGPLHLLRGNHPCPAPQCPSPPWSDGCRGPLLSCPGSQGQGAQEYEQRCKLHGRLSALR